MTCQGEHVFQHQIAWVSLPILASPPFLEIQWFSWKSSHFISAGRWGEEDDRVEDQVTYLVVVESVRGKDAPGTPPPVSRSLPGPTGHRALCGWGTRS